MGFWNTRQNGFTTSTGEQIKEIIKYYRVDTFVQSAKTQ
jgi:hypothetical protein